jgi:hypothetical protein
MLESASTLLILLTGYAAFACLALAQKQHWRTVAGPTHCPTGIQSLLRTLGAVLLFAGVTLSLALEEAVSFGVILYLTSLTIAGAMVAVTLAFWPRLFVPIVRACGGRREED